MKLLFLASGNRVPSCRFRVLQWIPHLQTAGHDCHVLQSFPQKYDSVSWLGFQASQRLKRLVRQAHLLRARLGRFDAIILERELFNDPTSDLEQRFRNIARTFILDVDDAVFQNFPDKFPRIVQMADLVLAGNANLRDWLAEFNSHVELMPTCVDTDVYLPGQATALDRTCPLVGWIGTPSGLPFLSEAAAGLRAAAERFEYELRVISTGPGLPAELDLSGVRVSFLPWKSCTEPGDIAGLDIGLMPLFNDEWSRYKCGFKLLQYMACGVPGIASPVGVNSEIVVHGVNGFLADSPDSWQAALERLLSDAGQRQSIGAAARQTVVEQYSVSANLPRWITAVESAVKRTARSQ